MSVAEAVEKIARLGGYRDNMQKRSPGAELLWRGIQRLNRWLASRSRRRDDAGSGALAATTCGWTCCPMNFTSRRNCRVLRMG